MNKLIKIVIGLFLLFAMSHASLEYDENTHKHKIVFKYP